MLKPIPTYRLIKNFPSIYKFCKGGLNKIALLLRKDVYPYEYMDNWEKFNKTSLPHKIAFYSKRNKKAITNIDYAHAQKVWEVFETEDMADYHDLYVQCDTVIAC